MPTTLKEYQEQGYLHLPNFYSPEEIASFRAEATRIFSQEPRMAKFDNPNVRNWAISRYPGLRQIFANGKLMQLVESVVGKDCVLLPNFGLHDSCLFGAWHRDTETPDYVGMRHRQPDYHFIKVGIYLQENHPVYAGGLDIVPGSHLTENSKTNDFTNTSRRVKWFLSQLVKRGLAPGWLLYGYRKGATSIPSQVGDLVLFNHHCDHRSTHPKKTDGGSDRRKLAMFMTFAPPNKHTDIYMSRTLDQGMWDYTYSPEYVAEMAKYGVRLYPLTGDSSRRIASAGVSTYSATY